MNHLIIVFAIIILVIAYIYYNIRTLYSTIDPPEGLPKLQCEKVDYNRLMEDFVMVDDTTLIACGADFIDFYQYYSIYNPGYIFKKGDLVLFDIKSKKFKNLELKNLPESLIFFPHGMELYIKNNKKYIYVINHALNNKDGERFEIFEIIYNQEIISHLNYIRSIKLPKEFMGSTNALAVVEENDIFFSTSFPEPPLAVDEVTPLKKFKFFLIYKLNYYLDLKWTYLYHYKDGKFTRIEKSNSACANGVAYDEKTGYVFVAQTYEKKIVVFKYDKISKNVIYERDIYLGYKIDNLIFDKERRILNAAISGKDFYGGLAEIHPDNNFNINYPFYDIINMTSASAIQIDKKVYIVSPIKKYVLICGQ